MRYLWMDEYMLKKNGVSKQFRPRRRWNCYQIGGKMFAAFCSDREGEPVITLKCAPEHAQQLIASSPDITPGYYMNKRHWISVRLESAVTDELLRALMDESYRLVKENLPVRQKETLQ